MRHLSDASDFRIQKAASVRQDESVEWSHHYRFSSSAMPVMLFGSTDIVGRVRAIDDRHVEEDIDGRLLVVAVTVQILIGGGVTVAGGVHCNSYGGSSSVVSIDSGQFVVVVHGGSVVVREVICSDGHGGNVHVDDSGGGVGGGDGGGVDNGGGGDGSVGDGHGEEGSFRNGHGSTIGHRIMDVGRCGRNVVVSGSD
ncbi:loricrin-like [Rhopalosiphum padi]|uniref:loricrin-like n=1 Tax=Rhopalosiphum padi TaxID=40932 RepID=UPI00298D70C5|nr:loricrin-like [Rhopalosiphum padi]